MAYSPYDYSRNLILSQVNKKEYEEQKKKREQAELTDYLVKSMGTPKPEPVKTLPTRSTNPRRLTGEARELQLNEVNNNLLPKTMWNFSNGLTKSLSFGLVDPSKGDFGANQDIVNKIQSGTPAKVGNFLGEMTGYAVPYSVGSKWLNAGGKALAGSKLGTKAIGQVAKTKVGQKLGEKALTKIAQGVGASVLGDATIGVAQNTGIALGEGKRGKDLLKDVAINSGVDLALGGAMEVAPTLLKLRKQGKALTKSEKTLNETLQGLSSNIDELALKNKKVADIPTQSLVKGTDIPTTKIDDIKRPLLPNGADVNKFPTTNKESTAKINSLLPDDKKVRYETTSMAQRREAARQRLDVDYKGEVDELLKKDLGKFTDEDIATGSLALQRMYDNGEDITEMARKLGEKSSLAGQELQATSHIVKDTPVGKLVQANVEVSKAIKKIKKKNPAKIQKVTEEITGVKKAVKGATDDALQETVKKIGISNAQLGKQLAEASKSTRTKLGLEIQATVVEKFSHLGEKEAKKLGLEARNFYEQKVKENIAKTLEKEFATRPPKEVKGIYEKILDLIDKGVYDDEALTNIIKRQNNIPVLDKQTADRILELATLSEQATDFKTKRQYQSMAEQIIADLTPSTGLEKLRSIQMMAMLSGSRTLLSRNAGSNLILGIPETIKDIPATFFDTIISKMTKQRTTTAPSLSKIGKQVGGMVEGVKDWNIDRKLGIDTALSRSMGELPSKKVWNPEFAKNTPQKYAYQTLNFFDKIIGDALKLGDRPFFQGAYRKREAELIDLMKKGKIAKMTEEEIGEECVRYGLDAVFQGDSAIARTADKIRKAMPCGLGYLILPFTKTPANIMDKLLDYSPAGMVKLVKELGNVKKGTFDQKKFVEVAGRMFTGGGAIMLGYTLADKGILTQDVWGDAKNSKEYYQDQAMGKQSFSLKLGDKYYSVDWASPVGNMLMLGGSLKDSGVDSDTVVEAILNGTQTAVDGVFDQSFLANVSQLLSGGDSITGNIMDVLLSSTSQFVPQALSQVTNLTDDYVRETYDSNKLQKQLNVLKSKVPFLSNTLPVKKDIMGNDVMKKQGRGKLDRALEYNVYPWNKSQAINDSVLNELDRVYNETGDNGVLLNKAEKKFKYQDQEYKVENGQEYSAMQKAEGQYAYSKLKELINSKEYQDMTIEERARALKKINDQAKEKSRETYLVSSGKVSQRDYNYGTLTDGLKKQVDEGVMNVDTAMDIHSKTIGKSTNMEKLLALKDYSDEELKSFGYKDPTIYKARALQESGYSIDQFNQLKELANLDGEKGIRQEELKEYLDNSNYSSLQRRLIFRMFFGDTNKNPY